MLTGRGRLALLLAVTVYVVAWALGTREAYLPAVGLVALPALAAVYVWLARGPFVLQRRGGPGEHVEGGVLDVRVRVEREGGLPVSAATLFDSMPSSGETAVPLVLRDGGLAGGYMLRGLPRGRYRLDAARLVVEDPFALARRTFTLDAGGTLVVYPRIVELDRLFPDGGGPNGHAGRFLLSRGAGFDLHSVREHQPGESLRRVHWPSTARRDRLMVKELEDAPRDEAAVVLDAIGGLDVGVAPDSSFEMIVRAAGSLVRSVAMEGARSALVVSGQRIERTVATTGDADWSAVMEVLASVRADGRRTLASALADGRDGLDAARLFLVTSDLSAGLVDRITAVVARRDIALVWVDPGSWGSSDAGAAPGRSPLLAALASRGVSVAHLRRGDDVARVLGTSRDRSLTPVESSS
jgi:uncharacterized protein (DUF58 family)